MVHGMPWQLSRGILIALLLASVHGTSSAQTLVAAPALPADVAAGAPATAGDLDANKARTRFLVSLPKASKFEVFALSYPTNRVIIEVDDVKVGLPAQPAGKPIGLVKSFRAGLSAANQTRIVINVTEPVIVSSARMGQAPGGRGEQLVVEIEPFGPVTASLGAPATLPTAPAGAAPAAQLQKASTSSEAIAPPPFSLGAGKLMPPSPRRAVHPEVQAERAFKPVIVIDPGHGGHDTGAKKNGAIEKEIVLAFGKILRDKLEATGRYRVLMTRDKDVFVPLGERVDFAERNKANLFIAVHCDYAGRSGANGATIYSLRDSVAKSLRRSTKGSLAGNVLSRDEVKAVKKASGDVDAVKSILADLAGREVDATTERTSAFARSVIANMGATTNMRQDPDKQASFRVLKTAQFPSVLIELAYVTNKEDAKRLQSDTWRNKVSDSIMTAVEKYFSNKLAQLPM
jgi:N-acetylmuramoyl-L-alanine amidase